MRIVAVSRILDEADIIEAFVRHTAAYVDHHIFIDNKSFDGTVEILHALKEEGFKITVFSNSSPFCNEKDYNTNLYKLAINDHKADWVIFLDADEFIDDRKIDVGFCGVLQRIPSMISCVRVRLTSYVATTRDNGSEPLITSRVRFRRDPGEVFKVIVRGNLLDRSVKVLDGNHGVEIDGGRACPWHDELSLTYAHFAERSLPQTIAKFTRGWAKALAAGPKCIERGTSIHYKEPFRIFRDRPRDLIEFRDFAIYNSLGGLIEDPIIYRGTALRYTPSVDEEARAVRMMMGYLEKLARHHGLLLDASPEARALAEQWAAAWVKVL
ncbi:glycosyltransferase family 2 protein [Rhodovastum atsumiense]|uniref:Glycosyltransferase n=1 Tax=Rhodovastum atsumiense TaxID=504468 RepID=A0A5M6IQU4_9PROT|nr:glycosyltransferase family 2 protein [Rhodovastum atsumiense]KAA5610652.1 glycosyltransferase [Rhodovastum atsumiense]